MPVSRRFVACLRCMRKSTRNNAVHWCGDSPTSCSTSMCLDQRAPSPFTASSIHPEIPRSGVNACRNLRQCRIKRCARYHRPLLIGQKNGWQKNGRVRRDCHPLGMTIFLLSIFLPTCVSCIAAWHRGRLRSTLLRCHFLAGHGQTVLFGIFRAVVACPEGAGTDQPGAECSAAPGGGGDWSPSPEAAAQADASIVSRAASFGPRGSLCR
jgi:hypothetical protein